MVCLFCNANWHESKDCEEYETKTERKKRPNSNRFCFSCSKESDVAHLRRDKKCKSNENCTAWYSTYHHNLFCKERVKALPPSLFLPKIDQDLLPRFFKQFDMDEKYLILVSSPSANVNFNHIKVMDSFEERKIMKCFETDFVVIVDNLALYKSDPPPRKRLFDLIKAKNIYLPPEISILDSSCPADMVLQLLSSSTKEFSMSSCPSNLFFSDLIRTAPNLESIYIYDWDTNVTYGDDWIKDLLKYQNGKNLKSLHIRLDKVDFNVEDLVQFIKEKCCKKASIHICFTQSLLDEDEDWYLFHYLEKRLEQYFDDDYDEESGTMWIGYDGVDGYITFSLGKIKEPVRAVTPPPQRVLKMIEKKRAAVPTRIMPSRAATKRKYV